MSPVLLQSNSTTFTSAANAQSLQYGSNVSSNTKLVVRVSVSGNVGGIVSVKDGAGNSWTKISSQALGGALANGELSVWALDTPSGDVATKPTITATASTSNWTGSMLLEEQSGIAFGNTLSAMVDGTPGTNNGSATGSTGSPTYSSSGSGEWLDSTYGDNGGSPTAYTWTKPAALTADANGVNTNSTADIAAANGPNAGGSESASWSLSGTTGSADWATILFAWKIQPEVLFDAVGPSSSGYQNSSPTATSGSGSWAHTLGGTATLITAWLAFDNTTTGTCTASIGGVAMTAFAANPIVNGSGGLSFAFYLFNPPTGSQTVSFSYSGMSGVLDGISAGSISFIFAASLGTPVTVTSNTGTTLSLSVPSVAVTSMVVGYGGFGDSPVGSTVTGTSRFEAGTLGSGGSSNGNAAGATNTGVGSVIVAWTGLGATDTNAGIAVEIKAGNPAGVLTPMGGPVEPPGFQSPMAWAPHLPPPFYQPQPPPVVQTPGVDAAAQIPPGFQSPMAWAQEMPPPYYPLPAIITAAPFIPSAERAGRRPGQRDGTGNPPFRGSAVTPLAGGVSQPPIPPEAVHDQRRPGQRDGTGNPPFRGSAPTWTQGISQPPIPPTSEHAARRPPKLPPHGEAVTPEISQPPLPPEAVRDARREPRTAVRGSSAQWDQGISQPPIIPKAIRDQERQPRIPPRSNIAQWDKGISQPPIPPQAVRDTRRMFRWPWRGSTAATFQAAAAIIPAVPLPSSEHASRRPPKLPPHGASEIPLAGGVSQPPIPPQAVHASRRPPRFPRSSEGSPPSPGFTPPVANRAPQTGQIRQRLIQLTHWKREATPTLPIVPPTYNPEALRDIRKPPRIPRSSEIKIAGGVSQPPIPPQAIRDVRKPPRIPRSTATWTKGASQPPIPPQAVHASRRPNRIPRSEISPPFIPPPPPFPPRSITIPRRVFLFLLKRVRPSAPPGPSTFVIHPGTVTITNSLVASVNITDSLADTVNITNTLDGTVAISNSLSGSVTITNSPAGTVTVGNAI